MMSTSVSMVEGIFGWSEVFKPANSRAILRASFAKMFLFSGFPSLPNVTVRSGPLEKLLLLLSDILARQSQGKLLLRTDLAEVVNQQITSLAGNAVAYMLTKQAISLPSSQASCFIL